MGWEMILCVVIFIVVGMISKKYNMNNKYTAGKHMFKNSDANLEENKKRDEELTNLYEKRAVNPFSYAFEEMVSRYGDDFREAFNYDYQGGLKPQYDYYSDGITDATRYFLGINSKNINNTRLHYIPL